MCLHDDRERHDQRRSVTSRLTTRVYFIVWSGYLPNQVDQLGGCPQVLVAHLVGLTTLGLLPKMMGGFCLGLRCTHLTLVVFRLARAAGLFR